MKTTSRRFGRSTAHEVVDEGMGGGGYPVVVSDLSVQSPVRVIPDSAPADLTVTQEPAAQPPYSGADGNFWGSGEQEKASRAWWRRRMTYIVATAIVAVVAVVASMLAFSGGSSQTKRISYTFPVEAFPQTGVTASRTWTIYEGKHPTLHGDLIFYSSRSDQVTVEELLPKSLVTQASQVTFLPEPRVISEDPVVVSYSISSALDGVTSATYNIPLPAGSDLTLAALHRWAAEQASETGQRYLASHTLNSIHITPASIVVKKGAAAYQLAVSGLQANGDPAPTVAFGAATWSVANPKVAKVSDKGLVTGLAIGRTTVRASVGKLSATATVIVSAAANVKATRPLKPLTSGPLSVGPNSIPSSIGPLPNGSVNTPVKQPVVKTTHKPVTGSQPPVGSPPLNPNPPPVVCPTAPPAPSGVKAFATSDTSVTVTWAAPSVPAGCGFTLAGYSVTGSGVATATATSASFSGLTSGSTVQYAVTASYGTNNSVAVASNAVTLPTPVCDATTETAPGTPAATASTTVAGEVAVSWGSAGFVAPCAVSSYTVLVNGVASQSGLTGNGATLESQTGTVSVAVTAVFADGTSQTSGATSVEATVLCSDGTTIAVPGSCPAPPAPPGP